MAFGLHVMRVAIIVKESLLMIFVFRAGRILSLFCCQTVSLWEMRILKGWRAKIAVLKI
jgi:hypothetical protein